MQGNQADEGRSRAETRPISPPRSLKRLTKAAENRVTDLTKLSVIEVDALGELDLCLE